MLNIELDLLMDLDLDLDPDLDPDQDLDLDLGADLELDNYRVGCACKSGYMGPTKTVLDTFSKTACSSACSS